LHNYGSAPPGPKNAQTAELRSQPTFSCASLPANPVLDVLKLPRCGLSAPFGYSGYQLSRTTRAIDLRVVYPKADGWTSHETRGPADRVGEEIQEHGRRDSASRVRFESQATELFCPLSRYPCLTAPRCGRKLAEIYPPREPLVVHG
jgi:hypothetical protein